MASTTSSEQPKIKLYWLDRSRSQRILWLLEALKLPYELEIIHRMKSHLAPPELKKIHPLGKSPVLSILPPGATEPVVIAESSFIVEYLLDHYATNSTLLPTRYKPGQEGQVGGETEEYMRFRYFLHYAEGSLMSILFVGFIIGMISSPSQPFFIRPITSLITSTINSQLIQPNYTTHFSFLTTQLQTSSGAYLCGTHLTGADILISYPLIAAVDQKVLSKEKYPELVAYVERLQEDEAYKRAVAKIVEVEGKYEIV